MVVFSQCMDCKSYIGKKGMHSVARHFWNVYLTYSMLEIF